MAHIILHTKGQTDEVIFDDLSLDMLADAETCVRESQSVQWAEDVLVPSDVWEHSRILDGLTPLAVLTLARNLGINPAIVAGRIKKELDDYRLLTHSVGGKEVNSHF